MLLNYKADQRVPNIFTKNAAHEDSSDVFCELHSGGHDNIMTSEVISLLDDLDYGVDSESLSSSQQSNYSISSAGSDDSNQPSSNGLLLVHSVINDDGLSFTHPASFDEVVNLSRRNDTLTTSSRLRRRKRRPAPNYYRSNPQPRRIGAPPRTSASSDGRGSSVSSMWKRKRAGWMLRISRSVSGVVGLQGICMCTV